MNELSMQLKKTEKMLTECRREATIKKSSLKLTVVYEVGKLEILKQAPDWELLKQRDHVVSRSLYVSYESFCLFNFFTVKSKYTRVYIICIF